MRHSCDGVRAAYCVQEREGESGGRGRERAHARAGGTGGHPKVPLRTLRARSCAPVSSAAGVTAGVVAQPAADQAVGCCPLHARPTPMCPPGVGGVWALRGAVALSPASDSRPASESRSAARSPASRSPASRSSARRRATSESSSAAARTSSSGGGGSVMLRAACQARRRHAQRMAAPWRLEKSRKF